jgi:hypothetical protein
MVVLHGIGPEDGWAPTPEEACKRTARRHMGTRLVDMTVPVGVGLHIECKYPHFLASGGVHWYGGTHLGCETGYFPTAEGVCVKRREPQAPLSCKAGQAGFGTGNPVAVSNGAKVQREIDPIGAGSTTLKIERTYRSFRSAWKSTTGGANWSFWFDRAFQPSRFERDGRPSQVGGAGSDGSVFEFRWNAAIRNQYILICRG